MASHSEAGSLPQVSVEHIAIDVNGNAQVAGSGIQVRHLVGLMQAHGYSAEHLQAQAYPQLTLAQIYDALAYYYDHRTEIDEQIVELDDSYERHLEAQRADANHSAFVVNMRARREATQGPTQ